MGDSLGDIAKSWLADPPWQKVFKHTFDVIVDYVTYILVAIGGLSTAPDYAWVFWALLATCALARAGRFGRKAGICVYSTASLGA